MRKPLTGLATVGLLIVALACGNGAEGLTAKQEEGATVPDLELTSAAFADGELIPQKFTCDGEGISPPLAWEHVPDGTTSFALLVEDPDAPSGTFDHWLLYNLPADITALSEGVPTDKALHDGALQGTNDFGEIGYGGPCPPSGPAHRYVFTLKALSDRLDAQAGLRKSELLDAIDNQVEVLDEAALTGEYAR